MPGYYYHPKNIDDQIDFIVGKNPRLYRHRISTIYKKRYGELGYMDPELMIK